MEKYPFNDRFQKQPPMKSACESKINSVENSFIGEFSLHQSQDHANLQKISFLDVSQIASFTKQNEKIKPKIAVSNPEEGYIRLKVITQLKRIILVKINQNQSVMSLKQKLCFQYKVLEAQNQQLLFNGESLKNQKLLISYGMKSNSQIYLIQSKTVNLIIQNKINKQTFMITFNNFDKIKKIKQKIQQNTNIEIQDQKLTYNSVELDQNQKSLIDYKISDCTLVVTDKKFISSIQVETKKIQIKYDKNKTSGVFDFNEVNNLTISEVLKHKIGDNNQQYAILLNKHIYSPHLIINQLQDKLGGDEQIHIMYAIKGKGLFYHLNLQSIKKSIDFQKYYKENVLQQINKLKESYLKKVQKLGEPYTNKNFYLIILAYETEVNRKIKDKTQFKESIYDQFQEKDISDLFAKQMINSLGQLSNYIGHTYSMIPQFRFSHINLKQGETYYIQSFWSTTKNKQYYQNERNTINNGTLYHIFSLRGKDLSFVGNNNQEIVFNPGTYFYIEKIQQKLKYDEIWLIQMPTPTRFNEDYALIIWVDDYPKNNLNQIGYIKMLFDNKYQILQLTSTMITEQWMYYFSWILNYAGIEFKVISDMKRQEGIGQNKKQNPTAGVDLLQKLVNNYGYSTDILIYCMKVQECIKIAKERKIPQQRIIVKSDNLDIIDFIQKL